MSKKSNRKKILSTAARLFSQKGYQGTSMRDVASAVGVTLPTIYHYFGSKQNLYDEAKIKVFRARSNRHIRRLRTEKDAASRVYDYLLALATDLMKDQIYYKLLHREMLDLGKSGLRRLSQESFKEGFDELTALLSQLGLDRPPAKLAMILYSLLFGLISTMRYAVYLDEGLAEIRSPEHFVALSLEQLIPEVDWPKAV